jgi:alcohol dehydrogenase class IV
VAVGGGSPTDCGKALGGGVVTNHCHVLDLKGVDNVMVPGPVIRCKSTTAGSSADVSQASAFKYVVSKRKAGIASNTMVPDISFIDPDTTLTM